ncbi:MAG: hypothetical protein P4M11_10430 [Candidatus Pacebacteria bacterium]|nr:hypothetical protein [Candidatus Paceibacterota bacterium]
MLKPRIDLIYKSDAVGKEGTEAFYFDDFIENQLQSKVAQGRLHLEKVDCTILSDARNR